MRVQLLHQQRTGVADMTTNHTPGPWIADEVWDEDGESMGLISVDAGKNQVCQINGIGFQDFDNARLIAAAPDLLAALESAIPNLEYLHATHSGSEAGRIWSSLQGCRAAIAKSRGE